MLINFKPTNPGTPYKITTRIWKETFQFFLGTELRSAEIRILYAYPNIELLDLQIDYDKAVFSAEPQRAEVFEATVANIGVQEFRQYLSDVKRKEEEKRKVWEKKIQKHLDEGKGYKTGVKVASEKRYTAVDDFNFNPFKLRKGKRKKNAT